GVANGGGATAAALHRAGGALCLLERRAQGLCRNGATCVKSKRTFFVPLAAGAQLLSFCLLSALEVIVRLQEQKPSTLPIADRTCLLQILFRLVPQYVDTPHAAIPSCLSAHLRRQSWQNVGTLAAPSSRRPVPLRRRGAR